MSVRSVLDEKGHCLAATLLSVVILSLFQENPNFWNKMLMEPIFKNLTIHPCSFPVVVMNSNVVCSGTLE
jgi:hypothetical protein